MLELWSYELLWQIKVLNRFRFLTLCKFEFANAFGNKKKKVESKDFKTFEKVFENKEKAFYLHKIF